MSCPCSGTAPKTSTAGILATTAAAWAGAHSGGAARYTSPVASNTRLGLAGGPSYKRHLLLLSSIGHAMWHTWKENTNNGRQYEVSECDRRTIAKRGSRERQVDCSYPIDWRLHTLLMFWHCARVDRTGPAPVGSKQYLVCVEKGYTDDVAAGTTCCKKTETTSGLKTLPWYSSMPGHTDPVPTRAPST